MDLKYIIEYFEFDSCEFIKYNSTQYQLICKEHNMIVVLELFDNKKVDDFLDCLIVCKDNANLPSIVNKISLIEKAIWG